MRADFRVAVGRNKNEMMKNGFRVLFFYSYCQAKKKMMQMYLYSCGRKYGLMHAPICFCVCVRKPTIRAIFQRLGEKGGSMKRGYSTAVFSYKGDGGEGGIVSESRRCVAVLSVRVVILLCPVLSYFINSSQFF